MKTKKLITVIAIIFFIVVPYMAIAGQTANRNNGSSAMEDLSMTNHNHDGSSMMMNGDSTMMNNGNMMAMMQKCQSTCGKMSDVKNDNSFVDPGTKKGSYGYFEHQRQKDNAGKEKK